ncbi:MAG: hypothetical protein HUU10_05860 [Bacteroidetes bacterium]|nr:hypothetical protein [Bacteroidota bacterium]
MAEKNLQSLLAELQDKIARNDPASSTVKLISGGKPAVLIKLVEESSEIWMAYRFETQNDLALELSQYWYYLLVLGLILQEPGWANRISSWPLKTPLKDETVTPKKLVQETASLAIRSGSFGADDLERLFHLSWEIGQQRELSLSAVLAHL